MKLLDKLKEWYRGKYIPPPENDPDSRLVFLETGRYEQPFLAKLLKKIIQFWLAHWQWVIGTILVIIGILVTL